jgi:hypothetical protein
MPSKISTPSARTFGASHFKSCESATITFPWLRRGGGSIGSFRAFPRRVR